MYLGFKNRLDAATLSAGSWTGLDNVKNRKLYSVARSTDATTANTKFQVDIGASYAIDYLSLHAHNLSSAATITLKAGTTAGASDTLNSTGNAAYSVTFDDLREFSTHYAIIITAGVSARYWTVEITDTGNSDGYIDIGRAGLWQGITPTYNMQWGVKYGINDGVSDTDRSLAGDFLYDTQVRKRTANFTLGFLTDTEKDDIHELNRVTGKTGEVLFYAGEQIYDMLGRLDEPGVLTRKFLNMNAIEYQVIEL